MMKDLQDLYNKVVGGYRLTYDEAVELAENTSAAELQALANDLRKHFTGDFFDTCSIMNARSGRCSEDCKWCSQSKYHRTNVDVYPLVSPDEALEMARHNAGKGVRRFSLVTSGRAMTDNEIVKCKEICDRIGAEVGIELCASMGLLTKPQLEALYASGVKRYHCNLETAPSYFPTLCTTHTTDEKIQTIRWAQEAGMEVCSGGIIGMGESLAQRIELAVVLRDIGVRSVPVNILNPIEGTRLAETAPLSDDEVITSLAMFRIVNPEAHIRFAGGRTRIKHLEGALLDGGVSASIVGDMLTTSGSDIDSDKELFKSKGFTI